MVTLTARLTEAAAKGAAIGGGILFFEDADRCFFLSALGDAPGADGCALHAYALMTNHVHLLITPDRDAGGGG